jgi:hypothetical protein
MFFYKCFVIYVAYLIQKQWGTVIYKSYLFKNNIVCLEKYVPLFID